MPKLNLAGLARYNKLWVAVATAVLQAVQAEIPMSATWHGWVTVALAGLGAAAVYAVPNKQPDPPAPASMLTFVASQSSGPTTTTPQPPLAAPSTPPGGSAQ